MRTTVIYAIAKWQARKWPGNTKFLFPSQPHTAHIILTRIQVYNNIFYRRYCSATCCVVSLSHSFAIAFWKFHIGNVQRNILLFFFFAQFVVIETNIHLTLTSTPFRYYSHFVESKEKQKTNEQHVPIKALQCKTFSRSRLLISPFTAIAVIRQRADFLRFIFFF